MSLMLYPAVFCYIYNGNINWKKSEALSYESVKKNVKEY